MRHILILSLLAALPAVADFREQIEADWLLQEKLRHVPPSPAMTTQADAEGGCDGLRTGKWGFHTGHGEMPWWQVDLGETRTVARVAIWNRCDDTAARNNRVMVRLSEDAETWRTVYEHDGTTFRGATDGKPLAVELDGAQCRFVRIQLPGTDYLHLDEVEVFGPEDPEENLALHRPADQVSVSQWSTPPQGVSTEPDWSVRVANVLTHCAGLVGDAQEASLDVSAEAAILERLKGIGPDKIDCPVYFEARWLQRRLALANPILDFDAILIAKRVPGSYNHMSDQYYGWWSRPGGGLYILSGFREDSPTAECISESFTEPGSFLRPTLSYDGTKVLFAWCKHYPALASEKDKLNKDNVPEDAFYHVFEMNVDGTGVRQLTRGKYDDFDARYLPGGRIAFLSTRRGQFLQCGPDTAALTLETNDLPDVYVRCGGGPERPVAVYTLHTMERGGGRLCPISPFEMFEWTPSVADDGTILYSRWDYVDRHNMPFMSLWSIHPDGTNSRIVYGNYTRAPHCTFEPRCIPNSRKIVFTASAHHAQTMGSLVLLDPAAGSEGADPVTRLTPEVAFPEIEGWPSASFANPWPLSERHYLVAWGPTASVHEGQQMPLNQMGVYLFDAAGNLELLYRDPAITSASPIPLRPRREPPVLASNVDWSAPKEGCFALADACRGLKTTARGDVKALRIIAVPAKTHPTMNRPTLGLTHDDPGKCVLGTVPVEADGSAYFRAPAGVMLFFQALDARGMAIQSMRGATHVHPGQTLSCIGCHESRHEAPSQTRMMALAREPSKIAPGPPGSWPLRFATLVQPVLNEHCVGCHNPKGKNRDFNLSPGKAWGTLTAYGSPSLAEHVMARYSAGASAEGGCVASTSAILAKITDQEGHHDVELGVEDLERFVTWMDTYAQRLGSFHLKQERQLIELRERWRPLLTERDGKDRPVGDDAKAKLVAGR